MFIVKKSASGDFLKRKLTKVPHTYFLPLHSLAEEWRAEVTFGGIAYFNLPSDADPHLNFIFPLKQKLTFWYPSCQANAAFFEWMIEEVIFLPPNVVNCINDYNLLLLLF